MLKVPGFAEPNSMPARFTPLPMRAGAAHESATTADKQMSSAKVFMRREYRLN